VKFRVLSAALIFCAGLSSAHPDEVAIYQKPLTIPTYRIGDPEVMPHWKTRFGKIYPYTMLDKLTDEKYDRTYRSLWLENEYVKVLVLPEIGGRVHGAQDKTNGYQFMFDQKVIKPALVGMAGAWISGGIEWNFPDGHRQSCFRNTDWRMVENPDGSKTVWTGEIERVYGMRWSAGTTVHPGRNWVETKVRLFNCTPYPHSFFFWANCGVRGTPEFRVITPGEVATGHGKHRFYRWPVHNGKDLRFWKNAPGGTSYFIVDSKSDFYGCYSPEHDGGMVHWSDHQIARGKKIWFCGTSPAGRLWEKVLTDGDLPLVELQIGVYADNQPDYHWIMPGETKVFSHFWLPIREIGVWDYANLEGTLKLKLENGTVKIGWSPTGRNPRAQVVLSSNEKEFFRRIVDADPATPLIAEIKAPGGTDLYSLKMTILSADEDTLLSYRHSKPAETPLPEPEPPLPEPEQVKSPGELFAFGDRFEKFRDPARGMEYYREALRRDPGDVRSNAALGLALLKQGRYEQALKNFETALERDRSFSKARYYCALACLRLGKNQEAEDHFSRAGYDPAYHATAHFELAQLSVSRGNLERALEHIERSIRGNGDNAQAWAVKSLVLNRLGRHSEALETALAIQALDPLDLLSLAEREAALDKMGLGERAAAIHDTLLQVTRRDSENHLELAVRYARCGCFREAADILELISGDRGADNVSPLVYYHLAYYNHLLGKRTDSDKFRVRGEKASPEYCFPSRLESFPVLAWAVARNPEDARAHYYLGTLYFSKEREDEAIVSLEKAVALEPANVVAWRNLGYAYAGQDELVPARSAYEAALRADPEASLALNELNKVYEKLDLPPEKWARLLENYLEKASRSDPLLKSLISLYVRLGRYDDALRWLTSHRFHSWEGRFEVHVYWVESHLVKGDLAFETGDYEKALEHYRLSLTYPENLEVKEQPNTIHVRKRYKVGLALEALGKKEEAVEVFQTVVNEKPGPNSAYQYFRGKALEKLGRGQEAREVYQKMLALLETESEAAGESGHSEEARARRGADRRRALMQFKRSLALEGLGRHQEAGALRQSALELDPRVSLRAFSPPMAGL
jgi:tetratricopeptide (TPR) repeat protein